MSEGTLFVFRIYFRKLNEGQNQQTEGVLGTFMPAERVCEMVGSMPRMVKIIPVNWELSKVVPGDNTVNIVNNNTNGGNCLRSMKLLTNSSALLLHKSYLCM